MSIFKEIIEGKITAEKIYEDEKILAIKDIAPHAPVHILIIPKKEYLSLHDIPEEEMSIVAECMTVAKKLADEFQVADGYRIVTNIGSDAGQAVFHLHFHLIGGKKLGPIG